MNEEWSFIDMKHIEVETFNFRNKNGIKKGIQYVDCTAFMYMSTIVLALPKSCYIHVLYMKVPMFKS